MSYDSPATFVTSISEPTSPLNFMVPEGQNLFEFICNKNYKLKVGDWISEGWEIYKSNPLIFIAIAVLIGLVGSIPYVGFILAIPLQAGLYYMVFNSLRPFHSNEDGAYLVSNRVDANDFFKGAVKFAGPTILLYILYILGVSLGFVCLILPGIFLLVVWGEIIPIYIEFHDYPLAFFKFSDYFTLSYRQLSKRFFGVLLTYLILALFAFSGVLALFIGLLITVPVAMIASCIMFRDIFGLRVRSAVPYNPYSFEMGSQQQQPVVQDGTQPMYNPSTGQGNVGTYAYMPTLQNPNGYPVLSVSNTVNQ